MALDSAPGNPGAKVDEESKSSSSTDGSSPSPEKEAKQGWRRWTKRNHQTSEDQQDEQSDVRPPVPLFSLYRFATRSEVTMMVIAAICAALHGATLPATMIIWGDTFDSFGDALGPGATEASLSLLTGQIGEKTGIVLGLAGGAFLLSFFQVKLQVQAALQQCIRIRKLYLRSLMKQDFTWYDQNKSGELTARVAADINVIQTGIGDKVVTVIQYLGNLIASFTVAFVFGWKLTLVILSAAPVLVIAGALIGKIAAQSTSKAQESYGAAGAIAQEALSLIRTVSAYAGQQEEIDSYESKLNDAYKQEVRKGHFSGFALGFINFVILAVYGLAFWAGGRFVRDEEMTVGDLFTVYFSVIQGVFGIGLAAPNLKALSAARGAAPRIWEVIDRESEIDPLSEAGIIPDHINGNIKFDAVSFSYKGAEKHTVLDDVKLDIAAGKTHALVGASGCGKSTAISLIERFYDPVKGTVRLDGVDIRELNVQWLRSQIGYVSQMPTLFATTIRENIAYGAALDVIKDPKRGKQTLQRQQVTEEQVIRAAKLANAHKFISKLPQGYDTMLGERGAKLSGGQKQRVAIARAIIRNPRILLLDEATSALDARSERVVQQALERAQEGRTTVIVAHRLSTVKNADSISMIKDGSIVEQGTHSELMQIEEGAYRKMVELQEIQIKKMQAEETKDDGMELLQRRSSSAYKSKTIDSTELITGEDKEEAEELKEVDKNVLWRSFKMNMSELPYILLGVCGSAIEGISWPVMAIVFSEALSEILTINRESRVAFWSLMYLVLGAAQMVGAYLKEAMLSISGERLTRRMRSLTFRALMRQEIGFFDMQENVTGTLSTRLATESSTLKEVTGNSFGVIVTGATTGLAGLIVSFTGCWRIALFVLSLVPFAAIASVSQMKMVTGFDAKAIKQFDASGAVASEAVDNIKTVTSLGIQDVFLTKYGDMMKVPLVQGGKSALVSSLAFGLSEFFVPALWGAAFWLGSKFIEQQQCSFPGLLKSITGIFFGAMMLGQLSLRFPNLAAAKIAATKIFRLLDRESPIDPSSEEGEHLTKCEGRVEFSNAVFEYPSRPRVPVLRNLSFRVAPGKTLALVGSSGCGKSTVVALIERFYDPRAGSVEIEGKNVRSLHLQSMRSHIGIVTQEPDLFSRTVRQNIIYGFSKEEGTEITDDQIVAAAKAANAHDFISELPQGYDTQVGERGGKLSGGQRQRLAIARSLVRQPRILLLDEATSALDARSERIVQLALDAARQGRTTIVVAHRLSTIKDADEIAVVSRGAITERGTHAELMEKNGEYVKLVRHQMSSAPEAI